MSAAWRRALACCFAFTLLGIAGTAGAQASPVDLVGIATNSTDQFYFECSGSPTCSGEFVAVTNKSGCSNPVSFAGTIQIAAPDISVAGPVSGSGTLTSDFDWQHNADGTCTPVPGAFTTDPMSFSGTSDGAVASVTYTVTDPNGTHVVTGTLVRPSVAYGSAQVSGSFSGTGSGGGHVGITFTCVGSPVCSGTYSGSIQDNGCSNAFAVSGAITFSGLDLSSGSFAGTVVLQNGDTQDQQNADGTCSAKSTTDLAVPFNGSFSGTDGTMTLAGTDDHGGTFSIPGTFSATGIGGTPPPTSTPPFTISVTSQITSSTATASAIIVPPAADVGKTQSVYVFAFAPRSLVKSAARLATKDDATGGCELAQLDPATGQLHAASASNLAAAFTGTLTAQGQSVSILNNVSTTSVAGATFFVGYGTNASTMLSNGVNANAVQIPGSQQCPAVFPKTPAELSGLWWGGPAENGWGIDFTQRGSAMFVAFYTYDAAGNPKWYVSDNCAMPASAATHGLCTGNLYEVTGASPLFGVASSGTGGSASKVGTLQVDFADTSHATMSFTIGSVSRTVPIMRQLVRSAPTIDYTDLWYAGEQAKGWGMAISQQSSAMFLAWFVYDASGRPVWYVAPACAVVTSGNGCAGDVYQVTGPPFGPTFDPNKVQPTKIGTVALTFTDPNNGTMNYTVNGTTGSKTIIRQVFQ